MSDHDKNRADNERILERQTVLTPEEQRLLRKAEPDFRNDIIDRLGKRVVELEKEIEIADREETELLCHYRTLTREHGER